MKFLIIVYLALSAIPSFACLNTYQFKVFPVGITNNDIITIDFQIYRTSTEEGKRWLELEIDAEQGDSEMWIIDAYISVYDKRQKLKSNTHFEKTYSIGESYLELLKKIYSKGYKRILEEYPKLDSFTPEYLSYCDFQKRCHLLEVAYEEKHNKDFLIYNEKQYEVEIIKDTTYFGFDRNRYHSERITEFHISSVRIYKCKDVELVVSHLETGHEISMGWITSDPEVVKENEMARLSKEYKPPIEFREIEHSVYEEPLLHHGYGFDVFIMKGK